jgi:glycyl-tRNA synthetase
LEDANTVTMDKLISLCKRRGFVFQGSEIYGGLANSWDYGPLGVEMKRNIRNEWWKSIVRQRDDVVGLEAAIIMNPKVWAASGHLQGFTDPLVECQNCQSRFREDQVETENCPKCGGDFGAPRQFNLMLKTFLGPLEETANTVYMRPETAQGMFVNFLNVLTASRKKLPFGIAQIGKSFRNEITPHNFIFRTREFEQMEMEYFVHPGLDEHWHSYWIQERFNWYIAHGIKEKNIRIRPHESDELSHYSKATSDIEYLFPWGWGELEGIANRTNFDLQAHSDASGHKLVYFDEETKSHITPYVIEPAAGVDRMMLAFMLDAYQEESIQTNSESGKQDIRTILKFHHSIAPVTVGILPLSRNEKLIPLSQEIYKDLRLNTHLNINYDDAQSIGRRYRRFDEIGAPYCVTIDFESLVDQQVTIRDRDTLVQKRLPIIELKSYLEEQIKRNGTS